MTTPMTVTQQHYEHDAQLKTTLRFREALPGLPAVARPIPQPRYHGNASAPASTVQDQCPCPHHLSLETGHIEPPQRSRRRQPRPAFHLQMRRPIYVPQRIRRAGTMQ